MLYDKEPMAFDVVVSVESFKMMFENTEFVDTCKRYDDALVDAFHINVSDTGWLAAPFTGDDRIGAGGGLPIVKHNVSDQGLVHVPSPFVPPAFTLQ